jgi:phospholipase C
MALADIEHVVVLMLENRSFDCMLGALYPASPQFDGLTGSETNLDPNKQAVKVWNQPRKVPRTDYIPDPDPGELWLDINTQIFGTPTVPTPPTPTMGGFVDNYLQQAATGDGVYDPSSVMHYFAPDQVPVISTLAKQFAVSDRWFASAPCQTWPNRFFAHCATANGYENNMPVHFPYDMETIFNRFEDAGMSNWKIYYGDIAQSHTLSQLLLLADHFHPYEEFHDDARNGTLPAYSFIEPHYFTVFWDLPNDQHPPHNIALGEKLIADVYNVLRGGPAWTRTLLIITYDEHGGCYDHVPPPSAVPPSTTPTAPFNFDRYGVRVPAVIVSPYVAPGTILRPPGATPFDHTSIIATLRERWPALGGPLTNRDAAAPNLAGALTLAQPTNPGPAHINPRRYTPSPAEVAQAQNMPLNGMQHALVRLAANLPNTVGAVSFKSSVAAQLQEARTEAPRPVPAGVDITHNAAAVEFIKRQMMNFVHGQ